MFFYHCAAFVCNQIHIEKTLKYTKMWKPFTGQRPSSIAIHPCEIQVLNVLFSHFWGGYGQLFPAGPQVSARRHGSALSRARGQQVQHAHTFRGISCAIHTLTPNCSHSYMHSQNPVSHLHAHALLHQTVSLILSVTPMMSHKIKADSLLLSFFHSHAHRRTPKVFICVWVARNPFHVSIFP